MRIRHFLFFALPLAALAGCSSSVMIGSDDGGTGRDAGPRVDGSNGEPCGANTCTDGTYCCNASCGICAPEGAGCIAIACPEPVVCSGEVCDAENAACCPGCLPGESFCSGPDGLCPAIDCPPGCLSDADCGAGGRCCFGCDSDGPGTCVDAGTPCPDVACPPPTCGDDTCGSDEQCCPGGCPGVADNCQPADEMCIIPDCPAPTCEPMRAYGEGECEAELGVRWNGDYCEGISGCSCIGSDCGRIYASMSECQSYHEGSCPGEAGCSSDLDCPEQMYCNGCNRGSCPFCLDCRADCAPLPCGHEGEPTCDEAKPECGDGVAIVKDGCWVCVDPNSCDPIASDDCRVTGCDAGETCQPCFVDYACIPEGAVC